MRIFVTGASGFVGGAATKQLVAHGHQVRAMSRSEQSDAAIRALGGEPVRCNLENVAASHVGDAEAVLHSAAHVEQWGTRETWQKFNVAGTARACAAGKEAGAKRFIHISTESVLWHGQSLRGVDEKYPLALNSPYPYSWSKARAEKLVREANEPPFETIVLRPRFVWGPGDTTLLPTILSVAKAGRWQWVSHGVCQTSTTHIANLVHAIELALTGGRGGEAYFVLDDGVRSMHEMISRMAAAKGVTLPENSLPAWIADAVGATCETLWSVLPLKGEPPITRFSAMILSRDCILSDAKARAEMGYAPVMSVDEGMHQLAL